MKTSSGRNDDFRNLLRRAGVVVLIVVVLATTAYPDDWPCWRGPNRDGISPEHITNWPPQRIWTAYVAPGYSEVVVSDHRVYTMGKSNGTDIVYCFSDAPSTTNPTPLWTYSYWSPGTGRHSGNGPEAKATPTVDGNYIYTLSDDGILNCLYTERGSGLERDQQSGQPGRVWHHRFAADRGKPGDSECLRTRPRL